MSQRKLLGEIFVEKGLITKKTLERALARSKRLRKRLGTLLEEMELITGDELAAALAEQYGYRVIGNFAQHSFPAEILEMIPADVALQNTLFPLKIENGKLALAMSDPTETKIVSNIAANQGLTIIPFIATKKDINAAICRHYLGKDLSAGGDKTVLIVEDDNMLGAVWSNLLAREGFRVKVATDGMDAYRSVISTMPQVIVTEKDIPKLDAYGLFDALRNIPETRHIPIILMTACTESEEEARAFEKGFFDFVFKPVKEVTLITRVRRAYQFLEREYGMIF